VGRDFPPVQTGPRAHPASCKIGTGSFPGVKCGRGVLLTTHPLPVPRCPPSGPHGTCNGNTLTLPFLLNSGSFAKNYGSTLTALLISAQDVRPALCNIKCYCNSFHMFCVNQTRWPCGLRRRSEAAWISGIAGSNYAEGVDVCLMYLLCAV